MTPFNQAIISECDQFHCVKILGEILAGENLLKGSFTRSFIAKNFVV
jgi:hypothetical protein